MTENELKQLKIDLIENTEAYWLPLLDELFRLAERGIDSEQEGEWKTGRPEKEAWYWVSLKGRIDIDPRPMRYDGYFFQYGGFAFTPFDSVFYWSIPITIPPTKEPENV